MLQPNFRKTKTHRIASDRKSVSFGAVGLQSMSGGQVTSGQTEAALKSMARHLDGAGRIWIRSFPDTLAPKQRTRGGKDRYMTHVERGNVLYEISGVPQKVAVEALRLGAANLPLQTRTTTRRAAR